MSKNRIDIEVEETMELLQGIKRVEADPYIYSKVVQKIDDSRSRAEDGAGIFKTKLGYACIAILITFNLITSAYIFNQTDEIEEISTYQEFAQDFNLNNGEHYFSEL